MIDLRSSYAGQARVSYVKTIADQPIPFCVGLLDSLSYLIYLLHLGEVAFYLPVVTAKVFLFFFLGHVRLKPIFAALPFLVAVSWAVAISSIFNNVELFDIARVLVVLISLVLSLALVGATGVASYSLGLALNGFLVAGLYLNAFRSGAIEELYGRALFFGGQHPNLGSELLSVITAASSFALRPASFVLLAGLSMACVWLMEGRSAEVAIIMAVGVYFLLSLWKRYGWRSTIRICAAAVSACVVASLLASIMGKDILSPVIDGLLNSVLLADNEYRGVGTGASGRDENWMTAIEMFTNSPLVGAGLNFVDRLNVLQPHNWVLYSLAQFGLLGVPVVVVFVIAIVRVGREDLQSLVRLTPMLPLVLLNDRFLNLNAYPFVMYVLIFCLGGAGSRDKPSSHRVHR